MSYTRQAALTRITILQTLSGVTLGDLVFNMDELTKNIETGLQQGFAYNAELVEEKQK